MIATTALLSGFSLLALPAAVLLDRGRALPLGWANLIVAGAALTVALLLLWSEPHSDGWWRALAALAACAVAASQASATTSRRRDDDPASVVWLHLAGLAAATFVATLVAFAAWQKVEDEGYYRILGAVAVAALLVTLLQPILRRTSRRSAPVEAEARFVATLADGRELAVPAGVASAIAGLDRDGAAVVRIERR